jgi:hypothetical protein
VQGVPGCFFDIREIFLVNTGILLGYSWANTGIALNTRLYPGILNKEDYGVPRVFILAIFSPGY